ncbi:MAG: hypothetical protein HYW49_10120 [Deltaproteobacteria bacterium]|nr:hypothetical protein [Deltaproteobacteria bacterium]
MSEKKKFGCIEMKRKIQAKIHEKTKNMTADELLAYYDERSKHNPLFKATQRRAIRSRKTLKKEAA